MTTCDLKTNPLSAKPPWTFKVGDLVWVLSHQRGAWVMYGPWYITFRIEYPDAFCYAFYGRDNFEAHAVEGDVFATKDEAEAALAARGGRIDRPLQWWES